MPPFDLRAGSLTGRHPYDSYATLGLLLSPWKSGATITALRDALYAQAVDWGELLHQANRQLCTPLLYARLVEDGLLTELPQELQEFLRLLHEANGERNAELRAALGELLHELERSGCASILLKGAATFFDGLYRDGDRIMGDLDVLIAPDAANEARRILERLGYSFARPHRDELDRLFPDNRHHHLPRAWRTGTPVVVELHTRVARRQGGRALPEPDVWRDRRVLVADGLRAHALSPTHRLLHNAVHALVPHGEFVQGNVSLAHLAEYAYLTRRYWPEIDWNDWHARAVRHRLSLELASYAALAHGLMDVPLPPATARRPWSARLHARRILLAAEVATRNEAPSPDGRRRNRLAQLWLHGYFRLRRPVWLWRNHFYRAGLRQLPRRAAHLLRHLLRGAASAPLSAAD